VIIINNFEAARTKAGLRQVDVAERLGIAQGTVSMWEQGHNNPRTELLPRIAAIYNCTIDDLLTGEEDTA